MASVGPRPDKSVDVSRHVGNVMPMTESDRTLLLLRHAKSDYPDGPNAPVDHGRPLAPRGIREAGLAGDWIKANAPAVDAVLCSTATRTRQTLARTGITADTRYEDDLYDTTPSAVLRLINGVADDVNTLLVVGHEPTMSGLAFALADPLTSDMHALEEMSSKYPTSAIAVLTTDLPWDRLALAMATLVEFHVPR